MASPDFREYIDLTVNDLQPAEIYAAARDYAMVSLPEFDPRTGTVEDALLGAISYISGQVTGAVNRLPNGLMEGILRLMGVNRDESTFASGNVIFTAIDDSGLTIPAGTQVSVSESTATGVITHVYETTASVTIAEGDTESLPVQIAAIEAGQKPNIADGSNMTILTPVSRLFQATFDGTLTQGADTESDEEFLNRAVTYLASLSRSLANAEQVTNFLLATYPEAFRAHTYDLTRLQEFVVDEIVFEGGDSLVHASVVAEANGPDLFVKQVKYTDEALTIVETIDTSTPFGDNVVVYGTVRVKGTSVPDYDGIWSFAGGIDTTTVGASTVYSVAYDYDTGTATTNITYPTYTPTMELLDQILWDAADALGSITVFVSDASGASLSIEDKAIISDSIRARAIAGLNVYVTDVIVAPITVTTTIKVLPGYSELDTRTAVDEMLTAYLSTEQYPFTDIIRKNALISMISQVAGVDYVDSLTLTSDDADLATVVSGNVEFTFKGTLPSADVTVSSV